MNLAEKAEVRRETFYKLTNSAEAPEVPSGNRNLFKGSRDFSGSDWAGGAGVYAEDYQDVKIFKKQSMWGGRSQYFEVKAGEEYVFSAYVKSSAETDRVTFYLAHNSKEPQAQGWVGLETADSWCAVRFDLTDEYKRIAIKIKITKDGWIMPRLERYNNDAYLFFGGYKLERGNVATPYSQAPEDLGWSMVTLVPTQSNRYLWKFEYVYYSDGTVEITQPTNISIAGVNGQTSHVHFAFADNATGGGFSLTTPKAYMGWYADFNEAASNDPTKYKWGKWKGDQGAPGGKGDDGKTSYLHLAFASSADGKTGFSFTESGQQYQGYYTDFTQTSSTDPTKYTWMDRRAGVEVGGVNLLHNSQGPFKPNKDNPYKHDNYIVYPKVTAYLEEGKQYIVTAKTDGAFSSNHVNVESDNILLWMVKQNGSVNQIISDTKTGGAGTVFVWNHPTGEYCLRVNAYHDEPDKSAWEVKIEEGNVKTTYTRNPEDVQSDIDSKADQALTQQQLNALAEQNSIVKAEMEAKASIDTVNQWITAYQNYVNANDEAKAESERNLQEASARILQLKTDVGTLRQQWDFIDTYMTVQNEGLIIGKSDGSAYAKFANDRISLFSGSSEVMYISQGVLRIENGIFTKTIQIGRFRFETHPADQDMLVLRYLGG